MPTTVIGAYLADYEKFAQREPGSEEPSEDEATLVAEIVATMETLGADQAVLDSGSIEVGGSGVFRVQRLEIGHRSGRCTGASDAVGSVPSGCRQGSLGPGTAVLPC